MRRLLVVFMAVAMLAVNCIAEEDSGSSSEGKLAGMIERLDDWAEKERGNAWDMDSKKDIKKLYGLYDEQYKDGIMSFVSEGDPEVFLNLDKKVIDASYDVLAIRMYVPKITVNFQGYIYYESPEGDSLGYAFNHVQEGWHTYYLDMNNEHITNFTKGVKDALVWGGPSGKIKKLWFCPVRIPGVEVKIDWIKLVKGADAEVRKEIWKSAPAQFGELFGDVERRVFPDMSSRLLKEPLFSFAGITDTHIGEPGEEHHYCHHGRVFDAVEQINRFKPDFVLHLGDIITSFPKYHVFESQLDNAMDLFNKTMEVPIYYAPGNHDVGDKHSFKVNKNHNAVDEGYIKEYEKRFEDDYHSFNYKDCHFIALNNEILNSGLKSEQKQWEWFEKDLEEAKNVKHIFVYFHNVLFWNDMDDVGPNNYEVVDEPARSRLLELFKKHRVKGVYTGHTHWSFHNTIDGVELHTLYSTTFTRPFRFVKYSIGYKGSALYNPHKAGYYIMRVYPEDVTTQFVQTYPRIPELRELQKNNRKQVFRVLPPSASEISDNLFGVNASVPVVEKSERVVVVDQPVTLPPQIGVKWLRIKDSHKVGSDISNELKRLTSIGKPKGMNLVLPLVIEGKDIDWKGIAGISDKITAWEILNRDGRGNKYGAGKYAEVVKQAAEELGRVAPGTRIVISGISIQDKTLLNEYVSKGLLKSADAVILEADIADMSISKYKELISGLRSKLKKVAPGTEVWVNLKGDSECSMDVEFTKGLIQLLVINQEYGIRCFVDADSSELGLLDMDVDPTYLYYVITGLSGLLDSGTVLADKPVINTSVGAGIEKRVFKDKDGKVCVAVWNTEKNSGIVSDISFEHAFSKKPVLVDPLTGTMQELDYKQQGNKIEISGVVIPDYPVFIY